MSNINKINVNGTDYDIEDATSRSSKLDKQQGTANVGKAMVVQSDGTLAPETISPSGSTAFADITGQPTDNTNLATALNGKVAVAQGTSKAGQMLVIGTDGNVTSEAKPTSAVWGNITGTLSSQSDLQSALNNKVTVETGKGLSTNDFTSTLKTKLDGVEDNAQVNVIEGVKDATGTLLPVSSKTVTLSKTAVGLSNVDNTSDANKPISTAMQTALDNKVTVVSGKGLSTNDFTTADKTAITNIETQLSSNPDGKLSDENFSTTLKTKLDAIPSTAQENVIETVKVNGTTLTPTDKAVNVTVPTKVSDLTNDSGFQTSSDISSAISTHNTATDAHQTLFNGKLSIEGPSGSPYTAGQIAKVDSDGKLKVMSAGTSSVAWNDVTSKPFKTVSTGLTVESDALKVNIGTTSDTVCAGNDSRLTDSRSPTAHASSHTDGTDDIQTASGTQKGLLSSTDWNTFNSKQDALTIDTALSDTSTNPVQNKTIASALGDKVDKVTGKGLSTEDFTSTLKTKLEGISNGAQVNVIETVKVNGSALSITDKSVDVSVPTKVSDITNDSGFQTATNVSDSISTHNSATDAHQTLFEAKLNKQYEAAQDGYIAKVDSTDHVLKVMPAGTSSVAFADITGQPADNSNLNSVLSAKLGTVYSATEDGYIAKVDSADHTLKVMPAGTTSVSFADVTGSPADNTSLNTALANKVDKETGKVLSANDFTDTLKTKLDGIAEGAEVNVQSDWSATSGDAAILNKPSSFNPSTHASTHNIGGTDAISTASSTSNGLLTSTDWNTFNSKQDALTIDSSLSESSTNPVQNKVVKSALDGKVDVVSGKGLSTNDYTTSEQSKLSGIETGAEVNKIASIKDASGTALTITDKSVTLSKSAVGLGNVDNTSDANKPISTATQTALNAKLGTVYTATEDGYIAKVDSSDHTLKVMPVGTTSVAFADVTGSPADNTALSTALSGKVDVVSGKSLVLDTEITKLSGVATGAQVNVIETVKVNGTALTPTDKAVNVTVPTALSSLSDDSTHRIVTDTEKTTWNGKQNAITSDAMLSSDLVDDTDKTHKFVSTTEKTTWNGKQDALTFDTEPIESSTNPVTSGAVYTALAGKEPSITKNTAFNKAFGTTTGTVCEGNDVRLSNARAPTAHSTTHNIGGTDAIATASSTTNGLLSSTDWTKFNSKQDVITLDDTPSESSNNPVKSSGIYTALSGKEPAITTKNTAFNKNFGTTAGTVCEGNDSRLTSVASATTTGLLTTTDWNTFNGKQNALTFDDTPSESSNNPVKSSGIYTALSGKASTTHASTHGKDASDAISIDATQVTSGILDSARLPHTAFQKLVTVADEAARLALTTAQVTDGDSVLQNDTQVMYFVADSSKLGTEEAFQIYLATTAWSTIAGKPSTFAPSTHASSHTDGTDDIQTASASQKGLLSSTDWNTFNNKQKVNQQLSCTIAASEWSNLTVTKTIEGVTKYCTVIVSPEPSSFSDYLTAGVRAVSQDDDELTFVCENLPTLDLEVNVVVLEV